METIYDLAGIGLGPFNLGLAALCQPIKKIKTIFLEQEAAFAWHPGLLIEGTTLQVTYLADLVTLADPSSKFSYLNFLRRQNRLLQFGIHENSYITRAEYNRYCQWAVTQLHNLLFNHRVKKIHFNKGDNCFELISFAKSNKPLRIIKARHIVTGIGTQPYIPGNLAEHLGADIIHAGDYMKHRNRFLQSANIVLVGSGQSAAEIFYDLLVKTAAGSTRLSWFTKSDRFYAMEHTRLSYEMTSPDYIDFFYSLSREQKERLLSRQHTLYKGINYQLINAIYDKLYHAGASLRERIKILAQAELKRISQKGTGAYELVFYHNALEKEFSVTGNSVILATGYKETAPDFLNGIKRMLNVDAAGKFAVKRNYALDKANRVFVQNAEMHTHGFNAPDLGLGAYRNAVIINTVLGQDYYPVDANTCFQTFGLI